MFCGCPTTFGARPNTQTCPVCLGMPGVLPVVNRRAVEFAIRTALAFSCRVNEACRFARKHYYYPDMPKNYQISQYEEPLAEDGFLEIDVEGGARAIGIQRLHLEEDVGKLVHEGTLETAQSSLVDFNRSGVALMETVSRPELRLTRGGRGIPASLPRRPDLPGRLRRQHGGGLAPLRRERLDPAPGQRHARHEGRDQEPELVPERAARARVRGAAPGAGARRGRAHRAGDAPVGGRPRLHALDALEGVRARLPLLPRARSGAAADRPPLGRGDPRGASGAAARLAAAGRRTVRAAGLRRRGADAVAGARRVLRGRAARVGPRVGAGADRPKVLSNWIMSELLRVLPGDDERAIQTSPIPPRHLVGLLQLDRELDDQRQDRQGRVPEDVRLGRGRRGRSSSATASPRSPTRARWPR